jgi:hypothetical protein
VVLVVRAEEVGELLSAMSTGRLDLVRVPTAAGTGGLASGGGG